VNLLLLAPLRDGKGKVRYYHGAQVGCSALVEGKRGVDGFERFMVKRKIEIGVKNDAKGKTLGALRERSAVFDLEECAAVRSGRRRGSISNVRNEDEKVRSLSKVRRRLDNGEDSGSGDDSEVEREGSEWRLAGGTKSGRLLELYKKYNLIRLYPSLGIIFVSQVARRVGKLQQRRFLAYVAARSSTLARLKESLESGTTVTAKIAFTDRAVRVERGRSQVDGARRDVCVAFQPHRC
jgi:hypothetical protein